MFFLTMFVFLNVSSSQNVSTIQIEPEMVLIPAGEFMMGSNESDDEKPAHKIYLDAFYLGKFEVTQKEWKAVMGISPSLWNGDDLPIEQVGWDDVQEYLRKLSEMTGQKYRLPTEAEWEYACRAGTTSKYYYGDDVGRLEEYVWFDENSIGITHPVGQKKPNAWGLYDMLGNVWEFCQDCYDKNYYSKSVDRNPVNSVQGKYRVIRGGYWGHDVSNLRCADRFSISSPYDRSNCIGFRVVRTH